MTTGKNIALTRWTSVGKVMSLISALRMMPSAYLMLFTFLPAILIPACASSKPAFYMIYSAFKLNKQGDNIQP